MKIIVTPASFKGSLSAIKAASIISKAVLKVIPNADVVEVPVSDGGEGLVNNFLAFFGGERINTTVHDPLMRAIDTYYGILPDNTAVIEMASASGLTLLSEDERNPLITTTYGTGELIINAINRGCKNILIGAGGSATCDCGTGALSAMGISFRDSDGVVVEGCGGNLSKIKMIDTSSIDKRILSAKIKIICDVTNPLYGENGASKTFAPQKGAKTDDVLLLDDNLKYFANLTERHFFIPSINIQHSGAAGGLAAGLFAFVNAELVNGIEFVLDKIDFKSLIKDSDLIITGEGYLDNQTKFSKAPYGIAQAAKKQNIKTLMLAGDYDVNSKNLYDDVFDYIYSITELGVSKNDAIEDAEYYLEQVATKALTKIFNL
ncbi:MAG: glycerate kinase [Ignavibacteria bacterium]|nr:glycerate kinase [Ignavibacteria bacterium]MDP3829688.1 glycerate kinase [Ignavibacteriaceae bacterium]